MHASVAKVLHPLCGRPMVCWVVDAAREAGCTPVVVVHHQEDAVRAALPGVACVRQEAPRGTGDAVRAARAVLPATGTVLVLPGDTPLVRPATLADLLVRHPGRACTLLTLHPADPGAYGRVVREGDRVLGVVEAAEATPVELGIQEVNAGIYALDAAWLVDRALPALRPHPPKGEFHLTDVVALAAKEGRLDAYGSDDPEELAGVNDRLALAHAEDVLQARILATHALAGVTFQRPATIRVEAGVVLAPDVVVEPGAVLAGSTVVGAGARIGAHAVLCDTVVAPGARVEPGSICEGARVGEEAVVGPMAHLRPGAVLERRARAGNFVEVKEAVLGEGVRASHLSYLGDATVGEGTNVGAGTITCNYDGYQKLATVIGKDVLIGSNTAFVAPVSVGDHAVIGAGSVVTHDVPADALAVGRARQVTHPDAAPQVRERFRSRAASAGRDPKR
ncbi:MAG: bifunctional UDP-N-acetylglucosamine diphosphorylase/glucosamine-1-phosphate N-acetyltransferase GlmU [Deltaproteobacteria bacterium]|nr:bifunctional UDP-N-acetylglucosamine diphosphorylase/glucosamine-1-phosphate N-acetyltransferase GlmU [Deltaproteobacteria bacterium]